MRRAYLANGILIQAARPADNVFYVDTTLFGYISSLADYCYLTVNCEIVKVVGVSAPNILLVERGIEGTNRSSYAINTTVRYKLTASEIIDATHYVGYSIVTSGGLTSTLGYGPLTVESIGGIVVTGADSSWRIDDIPANAGCYCDVPPEIPLNYEKYRLIDSGLYRSTTDNNYRRYL